MKNSYVQIYDSIVNTGGATLNFKKDELNPATGYMVSLSGYEQIVPRPLNIETFTKQVFNYLLTLERNIHNDPDVYLGFWINDTNMVIDLSERVMDIDNAIGLGQARNQICIYDCSTKCIIDIHSYTKILSLLLK